MLSGIFNDTDGGFDGTDEEFEQLIGRTVSFIIPKGAFVNSVFGQSLSRPSFLTMKTSKDLPFSDGSILYSSLVARVKQESPFEEAVQDQAVELLKILEPKSNESTLADSIIKEFVPSSDGSTSGFIDSIVTLLSSPHSRVVEAAFSFLFESICNSSFVVRCCLVESDLITKLFTTAQTLIQPISGNEEIIRNLITIIDEFVDLACPKLVNSLRITALAAFNHREMILQKVVLPSFHFVTFLISNRHILNEDLLGLFMYLLWKILEIGPFHRPTLEFVLASPILMALSSCSSFIEMNSTLNSIFFFIERSLEKWKNEGPEVLQSGKWMRRALFSEGFENTLEQMLIFDKGGYYGHRLVEDCLQLSKVLGSNMKRL